MMGCCGALRAPQQPITGDIYSLFDKSTAYIFPFLSPLKPHKISKKNERFLTQILQNSETKSYSCRLRRNLKFKYRYIPSVIATYISSQYTHISTAWAINNLRKYAPLIIACASVNIGNNRMRSKTNIM